MGTSHIPWSSIERYADNLAFDPDEREDLHHHIRAMDEVYLDHQAHKRQQPQGTVGKGKGK